MHVGAQWHLGVIFRAALQVADDVAFSQYECQPEFDSLGLFCQMLGLRGTAAVTLIPRDADEKCCQSKAIQYPSGTIDRR